MNLSSSQAFLREDLLRGSRENQIVVVVALGGTVGCFGHRKAETEAGVCRVLGASLGGEGYVVHQWKRAGWETGNLGYLLLSQFPLNMGKQQTVPLRDPRSVKGQGSHSGGLAQWLWSKHMFRIGV